MRLIALLFAASAAFAQYYPPGGGGPGSITGSGTAGSIPEWTASSVLGSSSITDIGGTVATTHAFQVGQVGTAGCVNFGDASTPSPTFTDLCSPATATGDLTINGTPIGATTNQNIRTIGASFGDFSSGASALSGSMIACVPTYFAGTIQAVELIATPSGSVTIDMRTVAHGSWTGPASTASVTASDIPALSSGTSYTDTTLTGWTTAVSANTDVCFYLTSPSTLSGVTISVKVAAN